MPQGHAHPAITKAVRERLELGTHFAPDQPGKARGREPRR
jgi:glutamate-1-semialdehyde aminotransferase